MARRFRKWLEKTRVLTFVVGRALGLWMRLCRTTTRWDIQGADALRATLQGGPVILVLWHEGAMMAPALWATTGAALSSLHDISPIGRISGSVQAHFGLQPMAMSSRHGNLAASRDILRRLQQGISVGLTGDGPLGPHRQLQDAALDWARASGRPVIVMGWAAARHRRLATWDRMILPLPFTHGRLIWAQWGGDLPRRPAPAELAQARADLSRLMSDAMDRAAAPH